MEDTRKLTAAIMGAIMAYLQTQQQYSSVVREVKSEAEANREWRNPTTNNGK